MRDADLHSAVKRSRCWSTREFFMDRRLALRFKVHLPISFSGDSLTGEGIVVNLSLGGCTIDSEQKVQPWKYLTLRIFMPDQDAPLVVDRAQVRSSRRRRLVVLEFLRMQLEEQERLRGFVATLETSPSPSR